MSPARRPAPAPLDVDVVPVVAIGTTVWFVAFLVLLPFHTSLADAGHDDWIWICLAGWTLGLLGVVLARAQRAARRAARSAAHTPDDPSAGPDG